jgi:hypothetical protein
MDRAMFDSTGEPNKITGANSRYAIQFDLD